MPKLAITTLCKYTDRTMLVGAAIIGLLALPNTVLAQYKYVGADGSVTYSDRPAPPDAKSVSGTRTTGVTGTPPNEELPFAVKQAAAKYPIIVYTTSDCAPCTSIKQHLNKRGVPFSEKTLRNAADMTAFKNLGFSEQSLPAISVGAQKQNDFEASALDGLLDIAGYPKSAKLPANYAAKTETLTPEPTRKTQVRVAEAPLVQNDAKAGPKKDVAPVKPKEPVIRF